MNVMNQTDSGYDGREPAKFTLPRHLRETRSRIINSASTRVAPHRDHAAYCTEPARLSPVEQAGRRWNFTALRTHSAGLKRRLSYALLEPAWQMPTDGFDGSSAQRQAASCVLQGLQLEEAEEGPKGSSCFKYPAGIFRS